MQQKMEVLFFKNGNTAVIDNISQQPDLQKPWLLIFAEFLDAKGIDPTEVIFHLPDGKRTAKFFRTENGLNWDVV